MRHLWDTPRGQAASRVFTYRHHDTLSDYGSAIAYETGCCDHSPYRRDGRRQYRGDTMLPAIRGDKARPPGSGALLRLRDQRCRLLVATNIALRIRISAVRFNGNSSTFRHQGRLLSTTSTVPLGL